MYCTRSPTRRLRSSLAGGASRAASNRAASQPLASLPQPDPRPSGRGLGRGLLVQLLRRTSRRPVASPVLLGVLEDVVGQIDARQRGTGVKLHHVIDVAAQNGRLHVASADHVVRHEQELLVLDPAVLGAHLGEFGDRDRTAGLCCKQQVQHRHEVRLTGTEAAVQVTRLAIGRIDGRLDEAESVVEAGDQLRRHDILIERLLGLGHAFGQVENEVAFADLVPAGSAVR